jgi:hypothetical protein
MTQTQTRLPMHQPQPQGSAKLVIVSLVIALAAVVLTDLYIERVKRQVQEESIPVFRLTHSVKEGDYLRDTKDWETVDVPKRFRESLEKVGVVVSLQKLENRKGQGHKFVRFAPAGTLITDTLFERASGEEDLTKIKEGSVLVSLPIEGSNQPGNLRAGMDVDIAGPFLTGGQIPEVLTVMERVQVFALGQHTIASDDDTKSARRIGNYRSITIMVKPQIARQLTMIQKMASGDFVLLVRKPDDNTVPAIDKGTINPRVIELLNSRLPKGAATAQTKF